MMRYLLVLLVACADPAVTLADYPCPPAGTQLTYETFGGTFFANHCNTCHSADVGDRAGAPESYRFDTVDDIRNHRDRIFVRAAASNTTMPPGPEDPAADERERLAEWLACGAP